MLLHGVPGVGKTSTAGNSKRLSLCRVMGTDNANIDDENASRILSSGHYFKSQAVRIARVDF